MEESLNWGCAGASLIPADDFNPNRGAPAFDAATLDHLNAIMRAYCNTLLIEPVPGGLLGLLDGLDAALNRRS
jgi:hypothetical protein